MPLRSFPRAEACIDAEHAAAWDWLDAQKQGYPDGLFVPPMRATTPALRRRRFEGGTLDEVAAARPGRGSRHTLTVSSPERDYTIEMQGGPVDGELVATTLFTHARRGTVVLFADGARRSLQLLFRWCWREWARLGYQVRVVPRGTQLMALIVRKSRQVWYLADLGSMTGLSEDELGAAISKTRGPCETGANVARRTRLWLEWYQEAIVAIFGTTARLTIGATAVAAASRHVPDDCWLWRPPPGMVAVCRAGGGFRGGYVHYPPYRGGAHKLDLRRAYTWALGEPLPVGASVGRCERDGVERPGIFLCTVYGPGSYPVSLATWRGSAEGFRRGNWSGDRCLAVVPSAEFTGLRALGYAVQPDWGYVFDRTFTLSGFVGLVETALRAHGDGSTLGLICKRLANAVYGKLAERSERLEIVVSREVPAGDYDPFIDTAGEEVADLWTRHEVSYRSHQHVDLATVITARVRGRLYEGIASLLANGIRTIAADTDGLLVTAKPPNVPDKAAAELGAWGYEGYDPSAIVAATRFFAFRGRAYTAGTSRQTPDVVAVAYDRGVVTVEGKVMTPAWSAGAMTRSVAKRLSRSRDGPVGA